MRFRLLSILCILSFSAIHAKESGYSQEEWTNVLNTNVDSAVMSLYVILGKNVADAVLSTEYEHEQDLLLLKMSAAKMRALRTSLASADPSSIPQILQDVRLTGQASRAIAAHTILLDRYHSRIQHSAESFCDDHTLKQISNDFKATGTFSAKSIILNLQEQMNQLIAKGAGNFQVNVTFTGGSGVTGSVDTGDGSTIQKVIIGGAGILGGIAGGIIAGPAGAIIGQLIGSIIGSLIGSIFCGIFFEDPTVAAVRKLREQSKYVVAAVDALGERGIYAPMKKFCGVYMKDSSLKDTLTEVGKHWPSLRLEAGKVADDAADTEKQIYADYQAELSRLVTDVYPALQTVLNDKFEACFAEIKTRSNESRRFAEMNLPAPLNAVLNVKTTGLERLTEQERLWNVLIDGEAKYSTLGNSQEILAWDGIAKAVYRTLDRKLPRLAQ